MRKFSAGALFIFFFFAAVCLLSFQGCASHLQTYPASEQDIGYTTSAFNRYRQMFLDRCKCCLDAEVDATVSVSGWFNNHTGKISGYLQGLEPGNIKFAALNPLGQPILIVTTDGDEFKCLNIHEGRAYIGSTDSETFREFMPPGLDPGFAYYWLIGGLPPGDMEILNISRDRENKGFWLQIRYEESTIDSMVLFDPADSVILRHIMMNDRGEHLVDLVYDAYQPENPNGDFCRFPTQIGVSSTSGANKNMDLKLFAIIPDAEFSPDDLDVRIPENFQQITVN